MVKASLLETARKLEGMGTAESVSRTIGISQKKAIELIHRLRKKGFVRTEGGGKQKRFYYISRQGLSGGTSYYNVINKHAPIGTGVWPLQDYKVHGRKVTEEEALIFAIKSNSIRTIIAALSLFKHITNWALLSRLAKGELKREVCALYDVAKKIMRVRRMPKRFKESAIPRKEDKYAYIVSKMGSDDFGKIETAWKVRIPLNMADLEEYRR